jgi:hypothetical protein
MLPTFFVIGAPKCGTTSLHYYLDQHPAISMSRVKEPWVFARQDYAERLGDYRDLFDRAAGVRGESTAVYSMYPHFPDVPERIARVVPDARFVYIVREPVERAVSHYEQLVTDGKEHRPLEVALLADDEPANVYLAASRYASQLKRYLRIWPPEPILVIEHSELMRRTPETVSRIYGFLDVDPSFSSPSFAMRLNTREGHRVRTALGARVAHSRPVELARRAPLPGAARKPLRRLLSRGVRRPELAPRVRAQLADELRHEIEWLREFTGLKLEDWPG